MGNRDERSGSTITTEAAIRRRPMRLTDWFLAGANAVVIAILLNAATAKLVAPSLSAAAIGELRSARRPIAVGLVRLLASIELVAAFAVPIPALRMPAQAVVGVLAIGFAGLGTLGVLRGSREPCGCFGSASSHPLGWINVALGLAFLGVVAVNVAVRHPHDASALASDTALLAVALSAAWLISAHRDQARAVVRNAVSRSEVSA